MVAIVLTIVTSVYGYSDAFASHGPIPLAVKMMDFMMEKIIPSARN